MITIDLGTLEYFVDGEFEYHHGGIVRFEHSLKAIYDWEAKWKIAFLKGELTSEQLLDYYVHMALDEFDTKFLTREVTDQLAEYIQDQQTATTFNQAQNGNNSTTKPKRYTAEEIYALMFSAGVSIEFETRNFNRLLTVLKIISTYNEQPKKMSAQDIAKQNSELNRQRRAQMKTKG